MWLSLVEYLNGVQVAAGSNPVTPTTSRQAFVACRVLFAQNTASGVGVSFACSDFFKSKKSFAASLLLLYPKRSRLLRLCPYKCGHNASAALPTFWEPCACLTNLSVFREPCVYGAFFLLKPLWLAAASERTSLCSDFCSRKNQSPAASFLLFPKKSSDFLGALFRLRTLQPSVFFISKNRSPTALLLLVSQKGTLRYHLFASLRLRRVLYTNIQLYRNRLRCRGRLSVRHLHQQFYK